MKFAGRLAVSRLLLLFSSLPFIIVLFSSRQDATESPVLLLFLSKLREIQLFSSLSGKDARKPCSFFFPYFKFSVIVLFSSRQAARSGDNLTNGAVEGNRHPGLLSKLN